MKFNRPLTPAFLKKWDQHLLLNRPDTWSARAHLVVYYCLLFMAALTIICFAVPNDHRMNSNVSIWVTFVCLLAFVGLIVWLIYLLRFNVFKRFGNIRIIDDLKTFLLYFLAIGMMVLAAYVPPVVETIRANAAYTGQEIVSDVNEMNTIALQLERDSVPRKWNADSFVVVNSLKGRSMTIDYDDRNDLHSTRDETYIGSHRVGLIDTAEFNEKYSTSDSLVRINDSLYVAYECPEYVFVSSNDAPEHSNVNELTSSGLYHKVLVNYHRPNKEQAIEALETLVRKYNPRMSGWMEFDPEDGPHKEYTSRIKNKYSLYGAGAGIENITRRMYRWDQSTILWSARTLYYVTIFLTLLVFMFRRTSTRTFFLTLLTLVLLSILTSLLFAFMRGSDLTSFTTVFIYYVVFLVCNLILGSRRIRNAFAGIALNLSLLMTAFLPLMGVAYYYEVLSNMHRNDRPYPFELFKNQYIHIAYGEIAGFALLLLMITFFFSNRYRLWFARPEQ